MDSAAYLPCQNLPPLLLLLGAVVRLSSGQPPVLVHLQSEVHTQRYPPTHLYNLLDETF